MSTTIQQAFYRNGQLHERVPVRNGCRHGIVRTWHKNSVLAVEEPYRDGVLHGVCRQWDEAARLLGQYTMVRGTGLQRAWHDNGKLQSEISTVRGEFCGRNRLWLRDGMLISERVYLHGQVVSLNRYREAAAKDKTLPKFRGPPAKLPPKDKTTQKHIHGVFIAWLLEKQNHSEGLKWFKEQTGEKSGRSLGRFKSEQEAEKLIKDLYRAGASVVILPDIYRSKAGQQFADGLLVRLPRNAAKRRAIRKVCAQLRKRKLGAVEPTEEIGETYLYLSLA